MTLFGTARQYLTLGFTHVIPFGFDHILFILCIFLMGNGIKQIIFLCSVFTLAHSISLGLASANMISINTRITEPLIALSILITAIQNIVGNTLYKWRMPAIFIFGLIHGLGFAGALKETGLAQDRFFSSLLFFNLGVEFGQIAIIIIAWYLIGKWFGENPWYKERVVYPLSTTTACVALYWTIERILS